MARPSDKRGRDRSRTIQLTGDVAEIAQKLADNNELSKVLSDLLRQNYGYATKMSKIQAQLAEIAESESELKVKKAQVEADLERARIQNSQNAGLKDEIEIKLESMIESLRFTEAMIQTGNKFNKLGVPYEKIKTTQSELVEKFRRQLEAFE